MAPLMIAGAGTLVAVVAVSAVGERRRVNRRDPDRVGIVDWRTVQLVALAALLALGYFWLRT